MKEKQEIRGLLLHFGANVWYDEWMDRSKPRGSQIATDYLQLDEALWRETTDRMAAGGLNTVVMDVAEAVVYPSHPELAVKGSWSVERFRAELARLRKIGLTPIPKLNFSTAHDTWLKEDSDDLPTMGDGRRIGHRRRIPRLSYRESRVPSVWLRWSRPQCERFTVGWAASRLCVAKFLFQEY